MTLRSIVISKLNLPDSPEATVNRILEVILKSNRYYKFYVRAHNAAGWGPITAAVQHLTLSDVAASSASTPILLLTSGAFILIMPFGELDTKYYKIYVNTSNDPGTAILLAELAHPTGFATIKIGQKTKNAVLTITSGTTYWFWVTLMDISGNESVSKTASDPVSGHITELTQITFEDPTTFADHQWEGLAVVGTAGENLVLGNLLHKKLNSGAWKYYKYDADGTDKLILPSGIATAVIASGSSGVILEDGIIRDDTWALSPSSDAAVTVYPSTTVGGLSLSPPGSAGDEVVVAGYLVAANTLRTKFGYAWVEI